MGSNLDHIYPVFDKMLPREAKEELLGQRGAVVWFTIITRDRMVMPDDIRSFCHRSRSDSAGSP